MKKSTLIVVAVAIALGAFVYFYDSKLSPKPTSEETAKPAFSLKPDQVTSLTIHRPSDTVAISKKGTDWELTQPVQTRADETTVGGIVNDLSDMTIQRSFAPTDSLSKYGLASPAVTIDFQEKSGKSHTVQLGDKDFSNDSVYAFIDGSKTVDLLPVSLLDEAGKSVTDLRDRSLIDLNGSEVTALTLDVSSGDISLDKVAAGWEVTSPREILADSSAVDGLVSSLSTDKFTGVVSETPTDLAQYGLAHPAMTVEVTAKGGKQFRLLLDKKGTDYYGHDSSRPMVFRLDATVYNSFDKKLFDLRDKSILQFDPSALATVTIRNTKGTVECSQGKGDQWSVVEPLSDKGKLIQSWKILDPLQNTRATQIYDTPSAGILAHLKKPAIEITLTDKSKKTTTIQVSAAAGSSVYVRTSSGPEIFEVSTQLLKDLGFKVSDLLN